MAISTHPVTALLPGDTPAPRSRDANRHRLLACGVIYAVLYVVANDLVAAWLYGEYSRTGQAISELSARGAPSQPFLTAMLPVFSVLLIAFGVGVWRSGRHELATRTAGALLIAQGLTAFLWLLAPMSPRDEIAAHRSTAADTLHLVLSALSVAFILTEIGLAAVHRSRPFRLFSLGAIATIVATGAATGMMSSGLAAGEPTRWLGLVERAMFATWLLWMSVFAVALWRAPAGTPRASQQAARASRPRDDRTR